MIFCRRCDMVPVSHEGRLCAECDPPVTTVHLHRPTSPAPVCGAEATDGAGITAYRSEITCPACLATLRPLGPRIVVITWPEEFDRSPEVFGPFDNDEAATDWLDTLVTEGTILGEALFLITHMAEPFDWSALSNDAMVSGS